MIEPAPAPTEDHTEDRTEAHFTPALQNPAVALCCQAWETVLLTTLKTTERPYTARRLASSSYRVALPPLCGYQNICDYIACVSYGISLGAIKPDAGSKLLYAAQIALSTIAPEDKTEKRKKRETPTPPPISLHDGEKQIA